MFEDLVGFSWELQIQNFTTLTEQEKEDEEKFKWTQYVFGKSDVDGGVFNL